MTIDERLEALTMNLELTAHAIEDMRKANEARDARLEAHSARIEDRLTRILDIVEKLAAVSEAHERRLTNLDGGNA
jgi:hypothetical protein